MGLKSWNRLWLFELGTYGNWWWLLHFRVQRGIVRRPIFSYKSSYKQNPTASVFFLWSWGVLFQIAFAQDEEGWVVGVLYCHFISAKGPACGQPKSNHNSSTLVTEPLCSCLSDRMITWNHHVAFWTNIAKNINKSSNIQPEIKLCKISPYPNNPYPNRHSTCVITWRHVSDGCHDSALLSKFRWEPGRTIWGWSSCDFDTGVPLVAWSWGR